MALALLARGVFRGVKPGAVEPGREAKSFVPFSSSSSSGGKLLHSHEGESRCHEYLAAASWRRLLLIAGKNVKLVIVWIND